MRGQLNWSEATNGYCFASAVRGVGGYYKIGEKTNVQKEKKVEV